jgi:hypothetical protein
MVIALAQIRALTTIYATIPKGSVPVLEFELDCPAAQG